MFNAIIIGSTGATGGALLQQLINNKNCNKIISIGRRPANNNKKNDKLVNVVIQSLFHLDSTINYWKGNDVFFNCIGTTRKRAGNAENFVDIELGISKIAARIASKSKIPHAAVISAKGADHTIWAHNWLHPLLYVKTMGEKEQTVLSNFPFKNVSIFRPGFLNRNIMKSNQKTFFPFMGKIGLSVNILAKAMMLNAESVYNKKINDNIQFFIGNEKIKNISKI